MGAGSGLGTAVVFVSSEWAAVANITSISRSGRDSGVDEAAPLPTTVKAGTTARYVEKVSTKMADAGQTTLSCVFDPADPPPYDAAPETITITRPFPAGKSGSQPIFSATGFINEWDWVINENFMRLNLTIKWSGDEAWTAST